MFRGRIQFRRSASSLPKQCAKRPSTMKPATSPRHILTRFTKAYERGKVALLSSMKISTQLSTTWSNAPGASGRQVMIGKTTFIMEDTNIHFQSSAHLNSAGSATENSALIPRSASGLGKYLEELIDKLDALDEIADNTAAKANSVTQKLQTIFEEEEEPYETSEVGRKDVRNGFMEVESVERFDCIDEDEEEDDREAEKEDSRRSRPEDSACVVDSGAFDDAIFEDQDVHHFGTGSIFNEESADEKSETEDEDEAEFSDDGIYICSLRNFRKGKGKTPAREATVSPTCPSDTVFDAEDDELLLPLPGFDIPDLHDSRDLSNRSAVNLTLASDDDLQSHKPLCRSESDRREQTTEKLCKRTVPKTLLEALAALPPHTPGVRPSKQRLPSSVSIDASEKHAGSSSNYEERAPISFRPRRCLLAPANY